MLGFASLTPKPLRAVVYLACFDLLSHKRNCVCGPIMIDFVFSGPCPGLCAGSDGGREPMGMNRVCMGQWLDFRSV